MPVHACKHVGIARKLHGESGSNLSSEIPKMRFEWTPHLSGKGVWFFVMLWASARKDFSMWQPPVYACCVYFEDSSCYGSLKNLWMYDYVFEFRGQPPGMEFCTYSRADIFRSRVMQKKMSECENERFSVECIFYVLCVTKDYLFWRVVCMLRVTIWCKKENQKRMWVYAIKFEYSHI